MKIKDRCPCAMSPLTSRESDVGNRVLDGFSSASWLLATQLCLTLGGPMDCSLLGSSVLGILWARVFLPGGGLPCPPPGDRPDPGIERGSPALQADSLLSEPPGKSFP